MTLANGSANIGKSSRTTFDTWFWANCSNGTKKVLFTISRG